MKNVCATKKQKKASVILICIILYLFGTVCILKINSYFHFCAPRFHHTLQLINQKTHTNCHTYRWNGSTLYAPNQQCDCTHTLSRLKWLTMPQVSERYKANWTRWMAAVKEPWQIAQVFFRDKTSSYENLM